MNQALPARLQLNTEAFRPQGQKHRGEIADLGRKPMVTLRAYVALCMGKDLAIAGKEIEKHLASGGNFEEAIKVMSEEMESSDFFRSLSQTSEA